MYIHILAGFDSEGHCFPPFSWFLLPLWLLLLCFLQLLIFSIQATKDFYYKRHHPNLPLFSFCTFCLVHAHGFNNHLFVNKLQTAYFRLIFSFEFQACTICPPLLTNFLCNFKHLKFTLRSKTKSSSLHRT